MKERETTMNWIFSTPCKELAQELVTSTRETSLRHKTAYDDWAFLLTISIEQYLKSFAEVNGGAKCSIPIDSQFSKTPRPDILQKAFDAILVKKDKDQYYEVQESRICGLVVALIEEAQSQADNLSQSWQRVWMCHGLLLSSTCKASQFKNKYQSEFLN